MEKETNVKKRKKGIMIFIIITIFAVVIAYILLFNDTLHICENQVGVIDREYNIQSGLVDSEYDIYFYEPSSEFENIEKNENSKVSYVMEKIAESEKSKQLKKGLIINSDKELENYIDLLNNVANTDGYNYMDRKQLFKSLDIDENILERKSLIVYLYNNDTHVVDIKVSDVQKNNDSVKIDIAVAEIDKNNVDSRYPMNISESRIIYVLTDKVSTDAVVMINKKNYDSSFEKQTRVYME